MVVWRVRWGANRRRPQALPRAIEERVFPARHDDLVSLSRTSPRILEGVRRATVRGPRRAGEAGESGGGGGGFPHR